MPLSKLIRLYTATSRVPTKLSTMGHKSALVAVLLLGALVGADVRQQQKTGKTKKRKSGGGKKKRTPKGHLQMFGKSHPPSWAIDEYSPGELSPQDFWEKYVNKREPVILRGETLTWPAHTLWTDEYLTEKYGDMEVIIEHKFENAGIDKSKMPLSDYLKKHGRESDGQRYVISELPSPMYKDVSVPTCLRCGSQYDQLVEVDLWISNGGTSAVMHRDPNNQLNCVVYDSKRWTLINATLVPELPFTWEDDIPPIHNSGGTVEFDFESVDLIKYPYMRTVPYTQAVMEAGDCIYVPGSYPHHVHSPGHDWSRKMPSWSRNVQVSFLFRGRTAQSIGTMRDSRDLPYTPLMCTNVSTERGSVHPLSEHPVAWQYPGNGPSSMGGANPHVVKERVIDGIHAQLKKEHLSQSSLARAQWDTMCARGIEAIAVEVLEPSRGVPRHDFGAISDSIDVALRDPDFNVGPAKHWLSKAVKAIAEDDRDDTHVIPGLRAAVIDMVHKQAVAFCSSVTLPNDRESGSAVGDGDAAVSVKQWLFALHAVAPITFMRKLLMMNAAWGIADCASFASRVYTKDGKYHVVERRNRLRYDEGGAYVDGGDDEDEDRKRNSDDEESDDEDAGVVGEARHRDDL